VCSLAVPTALAVTVALLAWLTLLPAPLDLLAFHPGEVVVLPRPPAFALLARGLILSFLILLPCQRSIGTRLPGRAALRALLSIPAARSAFPATLLGHDLSPWFSRYRINGAAQSMFPIFSPAHPGFEGGRANSTVVC
jgi:uncharacterized membrane protein YdfJ with MMPL/SSD domain